MLFKHGSLVLILLFFVSFIQAEVTGVVIGQTNVTGVEIVIPSTSSGTDTRVDNLIGNCTSPNFVNGVNADGTKVCSNPAATVSSDTFAGNYSNVVNRTTLEGFEYYNSSQINTTSLEDQSGFLGIKWSWLNGLFDNIRTMISDNRTAIEGSITGNYSQMAGTVTANRSAVETNLANNKTQWDSGTNSSYVSLVYNNSGQINISNGINTAYNLTFTNTSGNRICWANSTHTCDAWIVKNSSGIYIFGGN